MTDPTKEWRPRFTGHRRTVVYGAFEVMLLQAQVVTEHGLRWRTLGEVCGASVAAFANIAERFGFDGTVPPGAAEAYEESCKRMFAPLSGGAIESEEDR